MNATTENATATSGVPTRATTRSTPEGETRWRGPQNSAVSALAWVGRERSLERAVKRTALECGLHATTEVVNRALTEAAEINRATRQPLRRTSDVQGSPIAGRPGCRVLLNGAVGDPRSGTVLEVRDTGSDPSYLVEWADGDRSVLYPGAATRIFPPDQDHMD